MQYDEEIAEILKMDRDDLESLLTEIFLDELDKETQIHVENLISENEEILKEFRNDRQSIKSNHSP